MGIVSDTRNNLKKRRPEAGLGGRIRTCDPGHPKPVLYQTELRPDLRPASEYSHATRA